MNQELNASEAVYGFAAWLTTRAEVTRMGAGEDHAPIAALVKEFCEANSLPPVSDQWPHHLVHPCGEVAVSHLSEAVRLKGYEDYKSGIKVGDSPYAESDKMHWVWLGGWADAGMDAALRGEEVKP